MSKQAQRYVRRVRRAKNIVELALLTYGIDLAGLYPVLQHEIALAKRRLAGA